MAFPTSPVDGQIHGKYVYNSTIQAWEKYGDIKSRGSMQSKS